METRHERMCIIGTAQSWKLTPWTDPGLHIQSLNDAYRMKGFVRADSWMDIHPLDRFHHLEEGAVGVYAHQVPQGYYVRPKTHKEWLAQQQIPVWLHPDYQTQDPAAAHWPTARAFPRAEIEAHFGRYFTSTPAWMMAHQMMLGAKEIHIYGIHLATESEYIEQRPGFEFLCGRVLGPRKVTITVKDGVRHYETPDGHIVLPEASPILSSNFQYAFEKRPRAALDPLKWEAHKISIKAARRHHELRTAPWWKPLGSARRELEYLDAWSADVQEQMGRLQMEMQSHG